MKSRLFSARTVLTGISAMDTLTINSRIVFSFGNKPAEMRSKEVWLLQKRGKKLVIIQTSDRFMDCGQGTSRLVYNKL
jgi:hypothetical protein